MCVCGGGCQERKDDKLLTSTSAEKPSYGMAKTAFLAWTPDATNMVLLLKNSGDVGSNVSSIKRALTFVMIYPCKLVVLFLFML